MTQTIPQRKFEPGTTGWTVDDLSDPDVQWLWSEGRYELVEGVLTTMAPQGYQGISPLSHLRRLLERHLDATAQGGVFHNEVDLLLRPRRLARPDMIFLTDEQGRRQGQVARERGLAPDDYRPVLVVPLLVVESVSPGHEAHDRVTKREWYAEAGVPHYWLLTSHERSLMCLALDADGRYVEESAGRDGDTVRSAALGGVTIPLAGLWPPTA